MDQELTRLEKATERVRRAIDSLATEVRELKKFLLKPTKEAVRVPN